MKKVIITQSNYVIIGLVLVGVQMLLDTLNLANLSQDTKTIIGAIGMASALLVSGFKQYFDPKIGNSSIVIQALLFAVYVGGGLLELVDEMPLTDEAASIVRIILTFATSYIPILLNAINNGKDAR